MAFSIEENPRISITRSKDEAHQGEVLVSYSLTLNGSKDWYSEYIVDP